MRYGRVVDMASRFEGTRSGTRFRLFPVYAEGMPPEVVEISSPAGSIRSGPSDDTLYVADAAAKAEPYDPPNYDPPYSGTVLPGARPDAAGHFDHIAIDTPQFLAAHLFGSVRFTLDTWEDYLERSIHWWDGTAHPRMELIPVVDWENAQSGPGFIETGLWPSDDGDIQPFALNFDVVAHETGHQILFSQLGVPAADRITVPFLAFHESFADLIGLIAVMRFPSVRARLLQQTQGNLYVLNLVNRIGETSAHTQIRLAANQTTMADVADITMAPDGSWIDPTGQGRNQHWIGAPLTGAIFDVLVEIYQDLLVSERLIPDEANARGWTIDEIDASLSQLHQQFASALDRFDRQFDTIIQRARDTIGRAMAHVMRTVAPEDLTFDLVAARMIESLLVQGFGALLPAFLNHFKWRGIDPSPYLHFEPMREPRWPQSRQRFFRPQVSALRQGCACCHPEGSAHLLNAIRAAHAVGRSQHKRAGMRNSIRHGVKPV